MGIPGHGKKGCIDTKAPVMLWITRDKAQLSGDVCSLAPSLCPTISVSSQWEEKRKKGREERNGKEAAVQRKILILIFYFRQNNIVSLYVNRVWNDKYYMNLGSFSAAGHCKYLTQALPIYSQRNRNPRVAIYAQCFFSSIQIKLLPRAWPRLVPSGYLACSVVPTLGRAVNRDNLKAHVIEKALRWISRFSEPWWNSFVPPRLRFIQCFVYVLGQLLQRS